jgi:hypothetical protein
MQLFLPLQEYVVVRDGNELAAQIANRHYSRILRGNIKQNRLTTHERMRLVDPLGKWVFVWNRQNFRADGQSGANCVLFRNESDRLSSELILLAERVWNNQRGDCRKFTYVQADLIRSSNPGFCFQKAGWEKTKHRSKRGGVLLVKDPS